MKKFVILIMACCYGSGLAQEPASSMDTLHIDEVVVQREKSISGPSFDFYKANDFTSIDQLTSRLEGTHLLTRGGYAREPQLRGQSGSQIQLTVDGMHMFGACTDKMDPVSSYVETANLKSLNIKHGLAGLIYGTSTGGSYNLNLRQAKLGNKEFRGNLGTAYRSLTQGLHFSGEGQYQSEKIGLLINGNYRKEDNYTDGEGLEVRFSQYEKLNAYLSAKYAIKPNQTLTANVLFDEAFDIGYYALPMDVSRASAQMYSLKYALIPANQKIASLKAKLYANLVYHAMDDTKRDSVPMHMDMPGWSNTAGFTGETKLNLWNHHLSQIKLDLYHHYSRAEMTMYPNNDNEPPMFMLTWPDTRRSVAGLFLSDDWKLNAMIHLLLSLRIDFSHTAVTSEFGQKQFEVLGYDISEPQQKADVGGFISINNNLSKHNSLELRLGYGSRMPSVSELFGFYLFNAHDGYDYIGNPEIKHEQNANAEIKYLLNVDWLEANVSIWYNHLQNYIMGTVDSSLSSMTIGAAGVKQYQNYKHANLFGMDLHVQAKLNSQWSLVSTLKYSYGQIENGDAMPQIAPLKNLSSLRYQKNNIMLQGEVELSASQYRINVSYGETETDAYALFHLRSNYDLELFKAQVSIQLGIENLFDIAYKDHLDWGKSMHYQPGRNIYIGMNMAF